MPSINSDFVSLPPCTTNIFLPFFSASINFSWNKSAQELPIEEDTYPYRHFS